MDKPRPQPSLANLRNAVDLGKDWHGGEVGGVGDVEPIGNHTAGRVYDVERGCILFGRAGQDHAVVIGIADGRSVDSDVLRGGFVKADRSLHVMNDVAAAGLGLGFRLYVAGREAGNRRRRAARGRTLVVSGRGVRGGIQACIQRPGRG